MNLIVSMNLLDEAKEITSEQYMDLLNPIFKGQTIADANGKYWMVFSNHMFLYKIHCTL